MSKTLVEQFTSSDEGMKLFQQEKLILEFTEMICSLMNESHMSRSELADKLGTSQSHITQVLDGNRNMTLKTASDLAWALGKTVHFEAGPMSIHTIVSDQVWYYRDSGTATKVRFFTFSSKGSFSDKWDAYPTNKKTAPPIKIRFVG